ncbi:aldehyde oxidase [Desulfuromonas versatilis]|uniref:Aldehyde oxidase n=1 Tax=Desulfuromonas versatilis TaxID=2802975 RepID=A0ABN6E3M3_9BACT|nr:xanthine dehydrogenase family protein molybdopterin-binding subunit [Desulfuromonas versatilis]BCR06764.1 aldehyde oxidase [Desulfuromonas versatilis]
MNQSVDTRRRNFLKASAAVGGGLILGFYVPTRGATIAAAAEPPPPLDPNAWLRIAEDGTVTIIVAKAEMGQGVYTSMPMLIAEELECDWNQIRIEPAPVAPVYNHTVFGVQVTGGSTSVSSSWEQLRTVGAAAREMLIQAAADLWEVAPPACRAENGKVRHLASGREIGFGALSARAARLPVPTRMQLKDPKRFKIIGRSMPRLDTPAKLDGSARFGLDVTIPDMLVAVVARPPVFGAKLKNLRDQKARAVPGVQVVARVPTGVVVAARDFWSALQGREALELEWDEGDGGKLSSESLLKQYAELAKTPGAVARRDGDPETALAAAAKKIEAVYEVPYLAHATMEPLNCVVELGPERCEIWTGTQFQSGDRNAAALAAGLKPEQVTIHTMLLGGGFGRRANPHSDFVSEAVQVAKELKKPVKVVWTREDDTRGGHYRPLWYSKLAGGLDGEGKPVAWSHRIVGQSIIAGTAFEQAMIHNGIDGASVEGAADLPYAIPNLQVDLHSPTNPVPVQWWRSVGHSHTGFVVEGFIDELAAAAGRDPLQFRRELLAGHPRHKGVLELAAEKAGWGKPSAEGRGWGLAMHASFGSFVAQVAEVSVDAKGQIRVHRVVCAVDCGRVVNPDTVKAQMESGIVFGLSAALLGEITLHNGRVQQSNFHDYPILRLDETPEIEVHIVPSQEPPTGVGEPGVPPIAAAVANAVFAATGTRLRRLPMTVERVKEAGKTVTRKS